MIKIVHDLFFDFSQVVTVLQWLRWRFVEGANQWPLCSGCSGWGQTTIRTVAIKEAKLYAQRATPSKRVVSGL